MLLGQVGQIFTVPKLLLKSYSPVGGLNMSRALGDFQYKQSLNDISGGSLVKGQLRASTSPLGSQKGFVSNKPTVTQGQLSGQGKYILTLVSDGVTILWMMIA